MPILIIALVVVLIVAAYQRRKSPPRQCRWRADHTGDRGALRKYRCAACGVEAFTSTQGPPTICKSDTTPPTL